MFLMHLYAGVSKYTWMLISTKEKTPNSFKKLIADFNLWNPPKFFSFPYRIASETYVWSFQYRMLNFILFTKHRGWVTELDMKTVSFYVGTSGCVQCNVLRHTVKRLLLLSWQWSVSCDCISTWVFHNLPTLSSCFSLSPLPACEMWTTLTGYI